MEVKSIFVLLYLVIFYRVFSSKNKHYDQY